VSISSTFYEQLLRSQIPTSVKNTDDLTVFFTLLGSTSVKAVLRMLVKSTPDRMLRVILLSLFPHSPDYFRILSSFFSLNNILYVSYKCYSLFRV